MIDLAEAKKKFDGRDEDDEFEVKSEAIEVEKISKIILSFINGNSNRPFGYIVLGVKETNNKVNFNALQPIVFPVVFGDKRKLKHQLVIADVNEYITRITNYLKNNTSPKVDPNSHLKVNTESVPNVPNGYYIIIEIKRHDTHLIQYKQDRKFYARLKKEGQVDFESGPMDSDEIVKRMRDRYYSKSNLKETFYYDSTPAVPELTVLFDFIYFGDVNSASIVLQQIPTLTQMIDSKGCNAIHVAVMYEREEMLDILVRQHTMSIYQTDWEGDSPILTAAYVGSINIVNFFLEIDENLIYHRDKFGRDIFLKACFYGNSVLMNYLYTKYPQQFLNTRDYRGMDVLKMCLFAEDEGVTLIAILKLHTWEKSDLEEALKVHVADETIKSILHKVLSELRSKDKDIGEKVPIVVTSRESIFPSHVSFWRCVGLTGAALVAGTTFGIAISSYCK